MKEPLNGTDFEHFDSLWDGNKVKQSELNDQEADMAYVALVMDHLVGQFTLDEDIVYSLSPEKYKPLPSESPATPKAVITTHGVQSSFHPFTK